MNIEPGGRFGDYLLEERLSGPGGMGTVFKAKSLETGETCAVKLIRGDLAERPLFRARFKREGRILQALNHSNIVPIIEASEVAGVPYIATEFARDGDLRRFIGVDLETGTVLSILRQSAEGLEAAHKMGIIHRDVKPANLLVERDGGEPKIWVADFGVAWGKDFATAYTPFGKAVGTPGFMAPECQRGEEADCQADVYSLAACLAWILGDAKNNNPIKSVIAKAASQYPSDRHATVMAFYEDAARALRAAPDAPATFPWRPKGPFQQETRLDTPDDGTPVRDSGQQVKVVAQALHKLGLEGIVEEAHLARGRSDPRLVTGMLAVRDVARLRTHANPLAAELASQLAVDRVRLVLLPAGQTLPEVVRTYFSLIFADHVLPSDLSALSVRSDEGLLELDLPPRLERLCDEDALVPLVAHLGVRRVCLNAISPIPATS